MKIAIATPLYPPDIAQPAPYAKELARRLSGSHAVTLLTYGSIPESVANVTVRTIKKQSRIPIRLALFTYHLWKAVRTHEVIIIENGPSIELPMFFVGLFYNTPLIIHTGDPGAAARIKQSKFLGHIHRSLLTKGTPICEIPSARPEVLPFDSYPEKEMHAYEQSWSEHMRRISNHFHGN